VTCVIGTECCMSLPTDTIVDVLLRERLRIIALAMLIARDAHAADDIFQQVVLGAIKAPEKFRETGHVLAWALRMARHRAINLAKSRSLHTLPEETLDLLEAASTDPEILNSDRVEALRHCLDQLTPQTRRLLQLRYDNGLNCQTIANQLHRSLDAVYQNLSRVHRSLRSCIEMKLHGSIEASHSEVSS
jgi:RNA polymerase sigma-70 factor, ECF subfamily